MLEIKRVNCSFFVAECNKTPSPTCYALLSKFNGLGGGVGCPVRYTVLGVSIRVVFEYSNTTLMA